MTHESCYVFDKVDARDALPEALDEVDGAPL